MIGVSQIRDPSQAVKAKELLSESSLIKEVNVSVDPLFPSCTHILVRNYEFGLVLKISSNY